MYHCIYTNDDFLCSILVVYLIVGQLEGMMHSMNLKAANTLEDDGPLEQSLHKAFQQRGLTKEGSSLGGAAEATPCLGTIEREAMRGPAGGRPL